MTPETAIQTPAADLRAAAARLRELAGKASPGPWKAERGFGTGFVCPASAPADQSVAQAHIVRCADTAGRFGNAAWIAMMSPAVAEPLAVRFDQDADWADEVQTMMIDSGLVSGSIDDRWPLLQAGIAFARAILGVAS